MTTWSGLIVTRARRYWTAQILAAQAKGEPLTCSRCPKPVLPGETFDVDHLLPIDEGGVLGRVNQWPAHARCNRAHGASITNRKVSNRARRIERW